MVITGSDIRYQEERFIQGKTGNPEVCEDAIVECEHFYAVIDGVTAKSDFMYEGKTGGRLAAELICQAIRELDPRETAVSALTKLDAVIAAQYQSEEEKAVRPIQACVILYSKYRKEVWNYGDCCLMINETSPSHEKIIDSVLEHLRAFVIAAHLAKGGKPEEIAAHDIGRDAILPFIKAQTVFANADGYFGYPVINGAGINPNLITVYPVAEGDHIVLSSDGYPKLFSSLAESEAYLQHILQSDPLSYLENMQTKTRAKNNLSFDDRAYFSFFVK